MTSNEGNQPRPRSVEADSVLLIDVLKAVLERCGGQRWAVKPTDAWCYVTPPEHNSRAHGWKIHLSATPLSAPLVLARAAEVLVKAGVSFKFGTDLRRVAELVGQWYGRGGGGKFITVYPQDDERFRLLANELHQATEGLTGPEILSDKRLKPGSLVYYRYGEFNGDRPVFTDDGAFKRKMVGPDGTAVVDERNAWFSPPAWASSPFPDELVAAASVPESVLLAGRFRVHSAIRQANKGGVYRAVDETDGSSVVIKQARAHVDAALDGTDVRDRLRLEATMLESLAPLKIAPGLVLLFEEQGDLFLAQEEVSGRTMVDWTAAQHQEGGPRRGDTVTMAHRLVRLVRRIHEGGFVIRDLKPTNVIVSADDELRIVDVEYVARQGDAVRGIGTPGFMAPEIKASFRTIKPPSVAADCYSLGATVFHLITALPPTWLSRVTEDERDEKRELFLRVARSHPVLIDVADLIFGLTEPDPGSRWTLDHADRFLRRLARSSTKVATGTVPGYRRPDLGNVIEGQIDRLLSELTYDAPVLCEQRDGERDPCSAWTGAAGLLAALTNAATVRGDDARLRPAVARTAAWVDRQLFDIPRLIPGLAFGRGGTAWALYDAGRLLDDTGLQARAIELAERLPTHWPIADVTHGLSGAGLAHLHLWQATGNDRLLHRALTYADAVLGAAVHDGDNRFWPVPRDVDSDLAGLNNYGFAHGVAGIGTFLLAAAQAARAAGISDVERFDDAARLAGDTLARAVVPGGSGARWPRSIGHSQPVTGMYWCGGAGGIGSFLIRLWGGTGDQRYRDLAEDAAVTVTNGAWRQPVGACCGLSGAGHFLLDLAWHTGQESYRRQAEEIADVIATQNDLAGAHDHTHGIGLDYQSGVAGVLTFLLRLRHGGAPPWHPHGDAAKTPALVG